nr:MFS transporter [Micromonospora sp. DSM 115978]
DPPPEPDTTTAATDAATAPATVPNRWLVLVIVAVAQFVVVLDLTIVNVALPSIQQGLGFAPADLQWVINAYALAFGGFLLLGGRAADLLGRRRIFVAGLLLFAGASVLNGLATSPGILVAGRALQGLGGAMLSPAALSCPSSRPPSPTTTNAPRHSACGARSAPAAVRSACCSVAC